MNKEIYEPTYLEIIKFVTEDVIMTSGESSDLEPDQWEMPVTPNPTPEP